LRCSLCARARDETTTEQVPHESHVSSTSIVIAPGVNIGTVSAALGPAGATITWDRHHHLLPGTLVRVPIATPL
jgi:hypothetical protein